MTVVFLFVVAALVPLLTKNAAAEKVGVVFQDEAGNNVHHRRLKEKENIDILITSSLDGSVYVCENIEPMNVLCPIDSSLKITTYGANSKNTKTEQYSCSSFFSVDSKGDMQCDITLANSGVRGCFQREDEVCCFFQAAGDIESILECSPSQKVDFVDCALKPGEDASSCRTDVPQEGGLPFFSLS